MPGKMLQINLRFNVLASEMVKQFNTVAGHIAAVPGLRWKIFVMNERRNEAGGLYLFEDDASRKAYADGPIVAALKANKAVSEISLKDFDVVEEPTAVTRGPVSKQR